MLAFYEMTHIKETRFCIDFLKASSCFVKLSLICCNWWFTLLLNSPIFLFKLFVCLKHESKSNSKSLHYQILFVYIMSIFLNFSGTLINRKLIIQNLATFYSLSRNFIKFLFQRCWMLLLVLREELIWPYSKWRRRSRGAACSITFWLYYWWDFFVWNDGPRTEPQLWCHWGIGVGLKPKPNKKEIAKSKSNECILQCK